MPNDIDEFFTADDPAFSERLNTPMILTEIFSMKPVINLPTDFKNGEYPSDENKRKANFSIINVINVNCINTSDGFTANADNQEFTLRVYPNFHNFKWWNSITWTGTGTISVQMKDSKTGAILINNIGNGVNLNSFNIGHKQVDIIFTLSNGARVTNISFEYKNNPKNSSMDWQIPLANIQGLVTELAEKATKQELQALEDKIYYIGKIEHIAVDKTPSELDLPGTWEQMKGRFLLGSDGTIYPFGSKAGSSTHNLSNPEMPVHNHTGSISSVSLTTNSSGSHIHNPNSGERFITRTNGGSHGGLSTESPTVGSSYTYTTTTQTTSGGLHNHIINAHYHDLTINNNGSGQAHNNMPPYEVVHIWKRIS